MLNDLIYYARTILGFLVIPTIILLSLYILDKVIFKSNLNQSNTEKLNNSERVSYITSSFLLSLAISTGIILIYTLITISIYGLAGTLVAVFTPVYIFILTIILFLPIYSVIKKIKRKS